MKKLKRVLAVLLTAIMTANEKIETRAGSFTDSHHDTCNGNNSLCSGPEGKPDC